jgi:hypothetical protein
MLGEAPELLLREHELAVDGDLENAAATLLQDRLDPCLLLDVGRQTGGTGQVVSDDAVLDDDFHSLSPWQVFTFLMRSDRRA